MCSWQANLDIPSRGCAGEDIQPSARQRQGVVLHVPSKQLELSSLGMGGSRLYTGVQSHLALCCKATLPILCMGHVTINTDEHQGERSLLQAARCLTKQPSGTLHLVVWPRFDYMSTVDTRHLVDLRYPMLCEFAHPRGNRMGVPLLVLCHSHDSTHDGTNGNAALCSRSLLANLRKLTLISVAIPLPALQPVAMRLRELDVNASRLQGSADGFLTQGWTALTSLSLIDTRLENASWTAALDLPALEHMWLCRFMDHQGWELQVD